MANSRLRIRCHSDRASAEAGGDNRGFTQLLRSRGMDSVVAGPDEVVAGLRVGDVLVHCLWDSGRGEVLKVVHETHLTTTVNQVLQKEELHITVEVLEQGGEVGIPSQHPTQRTRYPCVVATDALQGEVKAVHDPGMEPAGGIESLFPIHPIPRE